MTTLLDRVRAELQASSLDEEARSYVEGSGRGGARCRAGGCAFGSEPTPAAPVSSPVPVELGWIEVAGFPGDCSRRSPRGASRVQGLTLVLGRNGSGKSSYVEALEGRAAGDELALGGPTALRLEAGVGEPAPPARAGECGSRWGFGSKARASAS